jgi:hypothetical protein
MTMRENKAFASLSSGLLARKGAAKPAMRPQSFGGAFGGSLEDLGWNDMGQDDEPEPAPRPMAALTPSPTRHAPEPAVVVQQRVLEESFAQPEPEPEPQAHEPQPQAVQPPAPQPAPTFNLPRRRGQVKTGTAKAAFTLRLDPKRHLKLRLACALGRQSAQQLVTGALDQYLDSLPELEALADRLPAEPGKRSR